MIKKIKQYINNPDNEHISFVLKGSILSFIAKTGVFLFGFCISYIIANKFGSQAVGALTLVVNSALILSALMLVGTDSSILRIIPEHKKNKNFSCFKTYIKMLGIVFFIALIIIVLISFFKSHLVNLFFNEFSNEYIFYLVLLLSIFKALEKFNLSMLRALKDIKFFALFQVLVPLLILICLVYLILNRKDLSIYLPIYINIFSVVFFSLIAFLVIKKISSSSGNFSPKVTSILVMSMPMMISSFLLLILSSVDVFIIKYFLSLEEVGVYTITIKIASLVLFFNTILNVIVAPKISELFYNENFKELEHLMKTITTINFVIVTPIVLLLSLLGTNILSIFGEGYTVGYSTLIVLLVSQLINAVSGPTGNFMNMTGNEVNLSKILFIAVVINIILNFLLIPQVGILGAAIATLISVAFWNIAILIFIKYKMGYLIYPQFRIILNFLVQTMKKVK